jgi:hypothetical protein
MHITDLDQLDRHLNKGDHQIAYAIALFLTFCAQLTLCISHQPHIYNKINWPFNIQIFISDFRHFLDGPANNEAPFETILNIDLK